MILKKFQNVRGGTLETHFKALEIEGPYQTTKTTVVGILFVYVLFRNRQNNGN